MLEEILDHRNVLKALKQVISNQGAGGVDGMQTEELRSYLEANWTAWKQSILEGTYRPSPVRKVEIPKPQGGKRMLGIPTVLDRLLQQCLYQWLNPKYDPEFSENSYGFREGRNAHQAVKQATDFSSMAQRLDLASISIATQLYTALTGTTAPSTAPQSLLLTLSILGGSMLIIST